MKNKKLENMPESSGESISLSVGDEPTNLPRDKTLNIYERLLNCMEEVDYIQKTVGSNNLKYNFAKHDAVTAKCRAAFVKNGIYPEVSILEDRLEKVLVHKEKAGYNGAPSIITDSDNYMSYIKLRIRFTNVDNPSDVAYGEGVGQGIDDQDKACGKATSYAYKYALLKALAIETGDDPENDVDFKLSNKSNNLVDKNAFGLSKTGSLADNDDMKETMNKKNEQDFAALKSIIENCGGESELKEVWLAKDNVKIINSLKKWRPDLYEFLVVAKDIMKGSLVVDLKKDLNAKPKITNYVNFDHDENDLIDFTRD